MNRPTPPSRQLLIKHLRGRIHKVETAGRNDDGTIVSSGCVEMDAILPGGGYNRGTIVEWLASRGSGAEYVALLAARNAAEGGGAIVIVDPRGEFFPPAARAAGINLGNLIVLTRSDFPGQAAGRNSTLIPDHLDEEDFLWAIDQSLRCSAVAAVWGNLPDFKTSLLADRWLRRFQLSAESSGCLGLFIKSNVGLPRFGQKASWSAVQWDLRPLRSVAENTRIVRLLLTRCRGGIAGRAMDLEIDLVTGNVEHARREHATRRIKTSHPLPLAAQLADPAIGRRAARA